MIVIGVDESGTGAWAGPYTVCAVAVEEQHQDLLRELGVRDSKKLSDQKRRRLVDSIVDLVIVAKCEVVSSASIHKMGKQETWRAAVINAAAYCVRVAGQGRIVVDGVRDAVVARGLKVKGITGLTFMPKADDKVPAVSAASIIAKTIRNDAMIALHEEYPEYNWKQNAGYPAPEHQAALDRFGKTKHHRPWKNLINVPLRA